jgi:hypothetical protein
MASLQEERHEFSGRLIQSLFSEIFFDQTANEVYFKFSTIFSPSSYGF